MIYGLDSDSKLGELLLICLQCKPGKEFIWGFQYHDIRPHLLRMFLLSWGTDCSGRGWTGASLWQEKRWVSLGFSWARCVVSWWESPWKVVILKDPSRVVFHCFDCAVLSQAILQQGQEKLLHHRPSYSLLKGGEDAAPSTLVRQVSPQNFDDVLRRAGRWWKFYCTGFSLETRKDSIINHRILWLFWLFDHGWRLWSMQFLSSNAMIWLREDWPSWL